MSVPQEVKGARHDALLDDDGHAAAVDVTYSNFLSALAAINVQDALDEIAGIGLTSYGGMVPYFIGSGETYTVPPFKQALFSELIDCAGTLDVLGLLIEVD